MAITPSTIVYLIKKNSAVPTNKHQLTFASREAQYNYFSSLPKIACEDFTYQRKNGTIRFPAHIDSIIEYNYVMYQNENYGDKWFYAYVTDMQYLNDSTTLISIATDVYQTWQFDFSFGECYVEREMCNVNQDDIYHNLVDEGLDTGDVTINYVEGLIQTDLLTPFYCIGFTGDSFNIGGVTINTAGQSGASIGKIPQGMCMIITDSLLDYRNVMFAINSEGKGSMIATCFVVPKSSVSSIFQPNTYNGDPLSPLPLERSRICVMKSGDLPISTGYIGIPLPQTIANNYTPRNKKLFQYPYNYLAFNPVNRTKENF